MRRIELADPIAELEARIFPGHVLSLYLPATPVPRRRYQESVFSATSGKRTSMLEPTSLKRLDGCRRLMMTFSGRSISRELLTRSQH